MEKNQTDGHVFVFPARRPEFDGKKLFYLFSIRQVAEVLNHSAIQPVPFAPRQTEGVTHWRGRILPVMSLEHCLGIDPVNDQGQLRIIVARTVTKDSSHKLNELYVVFKVGAAIRQINLPLICEPTSVPSWVADTTVLSGVYQLKDRLYMVMNMEAVLNTNFLRSRYVS